MRWSVRWHGPVATRIHVMGNSQLVEANDRARAGRTGSGSGVEKIYSRMGIAEGAFHV